MRWHSRFSVLAIEIRRDRINAIGAFWLSSASDVGVMLPWPMQKAEWVVVGYLLFVGVFTEGMASPEGRFGFVFFVFGIVEGEFLSYELM